LEDALHPPDRIALAIEEMADAAEKVDVLWAVIAPAAAPLERADLAEPGLPETENVLRQIEVGGHLADRAEGVRRLRFALILSRLVHRPGQSSSAAPLPARPWLMRCLRTLLALKTRTRRGEIGTSSPVFGLRPMRLPFG